MTKVILIAAEKVLTVFQKFQEASKLSRICQFKKIDSSNIKTLLNYLGPIVKKQTA
ncbi:hypothetical protein HAP39_12705, partial [Elizabethkingia miricola]|nr:hypothetical protein [Elizabethkingia miricola]